MAVFLRTTEKILLSLLVIACTVVMGKSADPALYIRHTIIAVVTVMLLLSVAARVFSGELKLPDTIPLGVVLFGLYFVAVALSATVAVNFSESLHEILRVFVFGTLFVLLLVVIDKDVMIKTLVVSGFILAVLGVYQCVFLAITKGGLAASEYTGTMCNKNFWASAFLLTLPFGVYAIIKYRWWWKIVAGFAVFGGILNIFLLLTRSVILAAITAAFVAACFNKKFFILFMILVVLAGSCVLYFTPARTLDTISLQERISLWKPTLKMVAKSPFLGVGAGNWKLIIPEYSSDLMLEDAFKRIYYRQPHNDFLWVMSESGIPAFLLYVSIFVVAAWRCIKTRNVLILAALTACLVDACFSFPKERAFHSLIQIILLAMAFSKGTPHHRAQGSKPPMWLSPAVSISMVVIVFAAVNFGLRYRSDCMMKNILKKKATPYFILEEAEKYSWFYTVDLTTTPVKFFTATANFAAGDLRRATNDFAKAYKANPNHPYVLNGLGACLAKQGKYLDALPLIEKALKILPNYPEAEQNLELILKRI
ncbi:hypothetical protein LCGC14_1470620 [marine sediment metagenome]|uniref:O-antigen ligase-related domain-containing protein n=1 Tax=marine sediment metagenome TaxID=412755 RepID=A0A0F9JCG0_9ZZZZ